MMLIGGSYPVLSMDDIEKRLPDNITADECDPHGHFRNMLAHCAKPSPHIEIITSASRAYAQENARQYEKLFHFLGADNVRTTSTHDIRQIRDNPGLTKRLEQADIIYFTGGDQTLLADLYRNTQVQDILHKRYLRDSGLLIAGTSAGAMIMARDMIDGNPAIKGNPTPMNTGFAMLPAVIETHTNERDREPRFLSAVAQSPGNIGIALDGGTALIIKNGKATVTGSGRVMVANRPESPLEQEGQHAADLETIEGCAPYKQNGMTAHIYRKGDQFTLGEYARVPSATRYLNNQPQQSIAVQNR